MTSTKIVPVPLCHYASLWNLLTSCLPGLTYFNLYQRLEYLITMCSFTQVYFIYNHIYTSTHWVTASWWAYLKFFWTPFKGVQGQFARGHKTSKNRKAGGSHLVNSQPTRLHLPEKDWRKLCKGKLTEFHVPFGSFPMNIYAGDNIWHLKTK